jgi:hypothetical protein
MRKILFLICAIGMSACRGDIASIEAYGKSAHIVCYSGGKVIYDGHSTGIVQNESQSDGYYFEDADTGRAKSVSGQCVIDYGG